MEPDESNGVALRELFIDELAAVTGGADPLEKVRQFIEDHLVTTYGCGEEVINTCA
jgi:hypothetical protein